MKNIKLCVLLALAALGTSVLPAAQTNLVQTLRINLTAYSQGAAVTNGNVISTTVNTTHIRNPEVILALGAATTNTFSPLATLVVVKPLPDGDARIVVRDAGKVVNVTKFFVHDHADAAVARARVNTVTGVVAGSEFSHHSFALKDADGSPELTLHFHVSGLTRAAFVSLLNRQGELIGEAYEYVAGVSGTADMDGTEALVQGTIAGQGRRIEIVP